MDVWVCVSVCVRTWVSQLMLRTNILKASSQVFLKSNDSDFSLRRSHCHLGNSCGTKHGAACLHMCCRLGNGEKRALSPTGGPFSGERFPTKNNDDNDDDDIDEDDDVDDDERDCHHHHSVHTGASTCSISLLWPC